MYESKFQKASNLIMEISIFSIFLASYVFQSTPDSKFTENMILGIIMLSQLTILIMTISKTIKDMIIEMRKKRSKRPNIFGKSNRSKYQKIYRHLSKESIPIIKRRFFTQS